MTSKHHLLTNYNDFSIKCIHQIREEIQNQLRNPKTSLALTVTTCLKLTRTFSDAQKHISSPKVYKMWRIMTVNFLPVSTCHFHFILQNAQPLVFHSNMKEANPQRGCKISNWITWPTRPASRYFQFAARRLISVTTSAQILFQSFSNQKAKISHK